MTRRNKHNIQARGTVARRPPWWIVGAIPLAVGVATGCCFWQQDASASGPNQSDLVGWWLRADGGCVLESSDPSPKGQLRAAYFNPQPINVSRAEWKPKKGLLRVFIGAYGMLIPGKDYDQWGAVAFFQKPVDDQALLDAISWAVSGCKEGS